MKCAMGSLNKYEAIKSVNDKDDHNIHRSNLPQNYYKINAYLCIDTLLNYTTKQVIAIILCLHLRM